MRQRIMRLNAVWAHLPEFGIVTAQGPHRILTLKGAIQDGEIPDLPPIIYTALEGLATRLDALTGETGRRERRLLAWHQADETSQRRSSIQSTFHGETLIELSLCAKY